MTTARPASGKALVVRASRRLGRGSVLRIPTSAFVWTGVVAAVASAGCLAAGKRHLALVLGQWAPTALLLGVLHELVAARPPPADPRQLH